MSLNLHLFRLFLFSINRPAREDPVNEAALAARAENNSAAAGELKYKTFSGKLTADQSAGKTASSCLKRDFIVKRYVLSDQMPVVDQKRTVGRYLYFFQRAETRDRQRAGTFGLHNKEAPAVGQNRPSQPLSLG